MCLPVLSPLCGAVQDGTDSSWQSLGDALAPGLPCHAVRLLSMVLAPLLWGCAKWHSRPLAVP